QVSPRAVRGLWLWPVPLLSRSGRIGIYGTADGTQDLQVQTQAHAPTTAGAWACAWLVPRPLEHGMRAAYRRLAATARLRLTLSAGGGTQGHPRRFPRLRGYPLACLARRPGAARQDVSDVLSPTAGRREGGLSALPEPRPVAFLHIQGVRQWSHAGQWLPGP